MICSFHTAFKPLVKRRNKLERENRMGFLTEVIIKPKKPRYPGEYRFLDLALTEMSQEEVPQPTGILAQFEFKYGWDYQRANVESRIRKEIRKILDGNEDWLVWGFEDRPARTEYIFLGLIADSWHEHIRGSSSDSRNDGILHPNGHHRYSRSTQAGDVPKLADHKSWQKYFELHGPFSIEESDEDWIKKENSNWALFKVHMDGRSEKIES
jgi:hypothetical protein